MNPPRHDAGEAHRPVPVPPLEVELKLAVDEPALDSLLSSELVRSHARSPLQTVSLHAVYYDTPDQRLRRRKLALRVRRNGHGYIQTLKAPADEAMGHAARAEWEVPREDLSPDLRAFDDPAVLDLTGLVLPGELEASFETRIRRRRLTLAWGEGIEPPALIEVAADTGFLVSGDERVAVSELELELLAGPSSSLYELAEQLRRVAPMRVEPVDKSARGWMLATGDPPGWRRAGDVSLTPGMSVETGLEAIMVSCLGHWLANEASARDGREPEGLHQLRVALRRIRSALTLFAPAMAAEVRQHWNDELRSLVNALGSARDLDVLVTQTLPAVRDADGSLAAFAGAAAEERRRAQAELADLMGGQRYADLVLSFAGWVARRGWRERADVDALLRQRALLRDHARKLLLKRHRRATEAGADLGGLDPEGRHRVRIALKKLRYGTEFFGGLFAGKPVSRYRKASARLQEALGSMNDVAIATGLVRTIVSGAAGDRVAVALGGGQVIGWHAARAAMLEPELLSDWRAFTAIDTFWTAQEAGSP